MPPVQRRSETKKKRPPRTARPHNHPRNGIGRGACGKNGTGNENPRCKEGTRWGVIIIIAVFWLLGLLMAWSMCVVAARADRRMEEIRHTHTDTDISRPADTGHVD